MHKKLKITHDEKAKEKSYEFLNSTGEDDVDTGEVVTIADRLTALTDELERNSSDSSDDEEQHTTKVGAGNREAEVGSVVDHGEQLSIPSAESLCVVLTQALRSSDEGQLEVVLGCGDHSVIENTVRQLESISDVMLLLTKLVYRIAKKPNRTEWLGGVWIKIVLSVHARSLLAGGDYSDRDALIKVLGPLRNMLTERTEALPHLLKLEGRLNLLNSHHTTTSGNAGVLVSSDKVFKHTMKETSF